MIKPTQQFMSLKQASEYLGISYQTAKRDYRGWSKWGVSFHRYNGQSNRLLFKRSELERMVDQWKIKI